MPVAAIVRNETQKPKSIDQILKQKISDAAKTLSKKP